MVHTTMHCLVITPARYHPNDGCLPAVARAGGVQPPWATAESSLKSSDTLTHRSASHVPAGSHTLCVPCMRISRVGDASLVKSKEVTGVRFHHTPLYYIYWEASRLLYQNLRAALVFCDPLTYGTQRV